MNDRERQQWEGKSFTAVFAELTFVVTGITSVVQGFTCLATGFTSVVMGFTSVVNTRKGTSNERERVRALRDAHSFSDAAAAKYNITPWTLATQSRSLSLSLSCRICLVRACTVDVGYACLLRCCSLGVIGSHFFIDLLRSPRSTRATIMASFFSLFFSACSSIMCAGSSRDVHCCKVQRSSDYRCSFFVFFFFERYQPYAYIYALTQHALPRT